MAEIGALTGRFGLSRQVARRLVRNPGDAWLAIRVLGWAVVLPMLKHRVPAAKLARFMWIPPKRGRDAEREETIVALSRLVTRARPGSTRNCYERSLISYRYLAREGADPRLVTGLTPDHSGHAWVTVDGKPVWELGNLTEFVEVATFGRDGELAR